MNEHSNIYTYYIYGNPNEISIGSCVPHNGIVIGINNEKLSDKAISEQLIKRYKQELEFHELMVSSLKNKIEKFNNSIKENSDG